MRLEFHNLAKHLERSLLSVYLVSGDEPLQCTEALDLIRAAARKRGYTEREILEHGTWFDWQRLEASANARSLFGERRLIELRLASAKIGNDGSNAIAAWFKRPPPDTVLLIASPKLERTPTGPKWIQLVEQQGGLLALWPVEPRELAGWLRPRLQRRGLMAEPGVAEWLAERVEGNLLAGTQEIEKLLLLQGPGPLSLEQAISAVADSARYNVFELADSAVDGNAARCVRILRNLRDEGTESALVLWVLVKEIRLLTGVALQARRGGSIPQILAGRREARKQRHSSYIKAVPRLPAWRWQRLLVKCAKADRAVKGMDTEDPWVLLEQLALGISGVGLLPR